jgi:glutathione S-transferase
MPTNPAQPIEFHTFPPAFDLFTPTPFGLKLQAYLELAKLPYRPVYASDPRKAPRGKMPFIVDGDVRMGDSGLIIEYLCAKYGDRLDSALTDDERARGHLVRRMLEESTYFCVLYSRWVDPAGQPITSGAFFGGIPAIIRPLAKRLVFSGTKEQVNLQGTGRHTRDEVYALAAADLTALSRALGDRDFLFGPAPTSFDAVGYGFLAQILYTPYESPMKEHTKSLENLVRYTDRLRALVNGRR